MAISRADQDRWASEEGLWRESIRQRRQDMTSELNSLEEDHRKTVDSLATAYKKQEEDLDKAYRVELDRLREVQAEALEQERKGHTAALNSERASKEKEFAKLRERERLRVESYKKAQDEIIEKLHEKSVAAQGEMKARQG